MYKNNKMKIKPKKNELLREFHKTKINFKIKDQIVLKHLIKF